MQDEDTVREAVILARRKREDAESANEGYKQTGDETWLHSRERMKYYRERKQKRQYYGNETEPLQNATDDVTGSLRNVTDDVTSSLRFVTQSTESESEAEVERARASPARKISTTTTAFSGDDTEALEFFSSVSGFMTIPATRDMPREAVLEKIGVILRTFGMQEGVAKSKTAYEVWCGRRRADGRSYSKLNPGWLDWVISGEIPEPYTPRSEPIPTPVEVYE